MLSVVFFKLRRGRADGCDRDGAIVASICGPFLAIAVVVRGTTPGPMSRSGYSACAHTGCDQDS